jgi:hypothetical protein
MENVLGAVVGRTTNDVLLLMVVIAVVAILIAVPLYKVVAKASTERRAQEIAREALILDVVKGNSAVMAELKGLLKETNENCGACKTDQVAFFQRIEDKQDLSTSILNEIRHEVLRPK